jgi:hypothetical protein
VARVVALVPDLLFGSKVQGMLSAAGHEVELVASADAARERAGSAEVVLVDLTAVEPDAFDPPTLGVYAHVEAEVRERALAAGYDLVVPRSRMMREGPALVERLVS